MKDVNININMVLDLAARVKDRVNLYMAGSGGEPHKRLKTTLAKDIELFPLEKSPSLDDTSTQGLVIDEEEEEEDIFFEKN